MKARIVVITLSTLFAAAAAATSARADTLSYAQCGTYDSYLLIYKTTDGFEELGKLRCDEKVEVLSRSGGYSQIRTLDGREGWVNDTDLSETLPPPRRVFGFGLTEQNRDVRSNAASSHPGLLTNDDILLMHTKYSDSDVILKKIVSSRCAFDTSPEAYRMLRASGLPYKVLLAMIEAPVASGTPERKAPEALQLKIPDGTALELELNDNVSSEEAREGAIVEMSAAEDLVVNGVLIIQRGSPARARIMAMQQRGPYGDSGQVAWFMQDIVTIGGDHIPATFAVKQPGNNRTRNYEGYPFFLSEFHKGDPAIRGADKRFEAVVHGDTVLSVSQSQSLTATTPSSEPSADGLKP